jgi:hypothetical protein
VSSFCSYSERKTVGIIFVAPCQIAELRAAQSWKARAVPGDTLSASVKRGIEEGGIHHSAARKKVTLQQLSESAAQKKPLVSPSSCRSPTSASASSRRSSSHASSSRSARAPPPSSSACRCWTPPRRAPPPSQPHLATPAPRCRVEWSSMKAASGRRRAHP